MAERLHLIQLYCTVYVRVLRAAISYRSCADDQSFKVGPRLAVFNQYKYSTVYTRT